MRRRAVATCLLAVLVLGSWGPFVNDDRDQAIAYHNLAHGDLLLWEIPESVALEPFGEEQEGEHIRDESRLDPLGSTPLSLLAMPAGWLVQIADAIAPLPWLLSLLAVALAWTALGWPAPWNVRDGRPRALAWLGAAGAVALAARGFTGPALDVERHLPFLAVQTANLALYAACVAVWWDLMARRVPTPWVRWLLLVAVCMGPVLFWAQTLKYKVLGILLLLLLARLLDRPAAERTWRTWLGVGMLAGLALWNHPGLGLVVAAGAALVVLAAMMRVARANGAVRPAAVLGAAALLGVAVGTIPMHIESTLVYGAPGYSQYYPPPGGAPRIDRATGNLLALAIPLDAVVGLVMAVGDLGSTLWGFFVDITDWSGPADFARNLWTIFVAGSNAEGRPLAILAISPLLALAGVGAWAALRRRDDAVLAFAIACLAVQTVVYTNYSPTQGGGYDLRYWLHVVPLLGLLAAHAVRRPLPGTTRQAALWLLVPAAAALGVVLAVGPAPGVDGDTMYAHARRWVLLALAAFVGVGLLVAAWAAVRRRWADAALPLLGLAAAATLVWTVLALLSAVTVLVTPDARAEAAPILPAMHDVDLWVIRRIEPAYEQPPAIVYDEQGRMLWHPTYGFCQEPPYPCPGESGPSTRTTSEGTTASPPGTSPSSASPTVG